MDDKQEVPDEPESGWGHWIEDVCGDPIAPRPNDALVELLHSIDEVAESDQGLERFLGQIGPLARDIAFAERSGVRIMSLMSAKGLTAKATIIPALEEGLIPRPDCDLGEERRLLYVGMTRAREFLYATWARRRRGPTARAGSPSVGDRRRHSRFLDGGPVESEDGGGIHLQSPLAFFTVLCVEFMAARTHCAEGVPLGDQPVGASFRAPTELQDTWSSPPRGDCFLPGYGVDSLDVEIDLA